MGITEEASALIAQNQFKDALVLLVELLSSSNAQTAERKIAASLISQKLSQEIHANDYVNIWTKIGNLWFEENEYLNALEAYKKIEDSGVVDGQIKIKIILSYLRVGNLSESSIRLMKYLKELSRKKNSSKIIDFLNLLETENFDLRKFDYFKTIANCYRGIYSEFDNEEPELKEIVKSLNNVKEQEAKALKNKLYIQNNNELQQEDRKKIISKIFESYLLGCKYEEYIPTLIKYVLVVKRRELAYLLLRRSAEIEQVKRLYKEDLEKISKGLEEYKPFRFDSEDLDMGEDLFSTVFPAANRRDMKIERLRNKYEIFQANGYKEQAKEVLELLNEIDPDNKITIHEELNSTQKSRLGKNQSLNNSKIMELLDEVDLAAAVYGTSKLNNNSFEHQLRVVKKHVESLSECEVRESGKDILISLLSMELYEICLEFIKEKGSLIISDVVERLYLQSVCYFRMNKLLLAIEKIDEALLVEMNNAQRCNILLCKAEMLRFTGKVAQSLSVYRQILKIDPKNKLANARSLQIV
jgi:tetratricopeptide (TPR) repeat protein